MPTDAKFARTLAGLTEPLEVLTPIALASAPGPRSGCGPGRGGGGFGSSLPPLSGTWRGAMIFSWWKAPGLYVPLIGMDFLVLDLIRVGLAPGGGGPMAGDHRPDGFTVKAAQARGIDVTGVILKNATPKSRDWRRRPIRAIRGAHRVPILGLLPEVPDLTAPAGREVFLAAI